MSALDRFPRPGVTVDIVALRLPRSALELLTATRSNAPFAGRLALPGGFLNLGETLRDAAQRVLEDKVHLKGLYLEQLYTFDALRRDPRGRVLSVAYLAILPKDAAEEGSGRWVNAERHPRLAFDHDAIVGDALDRLAGKLHYSSIGLRFLPMEFTRADAQAVYEALLRRPLDKRNFSKQLFAFPEVVATGRSTTGGAHRPAALYRLRDRATLSY